MVLCLKARESRSLPGLLNAFGLDVELFEKAASERRRLFLFAWLMSCRGLAAILADVYLACPCLPVYVGSSGEKGGFRGSKVSIDD